MEELESQIAKIQLGGGKSASSFVYVVAEKSSGSDAELFVVAELPMLNPAAEESCQRICLAIFSALKRSYRQKPGPNTFENALGQINEELGKLASGGQTQWIDKLNAIVGVKNGRGFDISTCGKVSAFLLRNSEFTDISCSSDRSHPLKTFETFASGKIHLNDLLILSTTQLFNHLAMDRFLKIIESVPFLTAAQTIIEILKENADQQTAFGAILNLQVPPGQTQIEEMDLENYVVEAPSAGPGLPAKTWAFVKNLIPTFGPKTRVAQTGLPKISFSQRLKNLKLNTEALAVKSKTFWQRAKTSAGSFSAAASVENFKGLSPQKKFFFISALILLAAVIININIAWHLKNTRTNHAKILNQLQETQKLLTSSASSALYKDDAAAADYFSQAKNKLPKANEVDSENKTLYQQVLTQLQQQQQNIEKAQEVKAESVGNLGQSDFLITLPNYFAIQINSALISYNRQNGKIEDSSLKLAQTAIKIAYLNDALAAVYDGQGLYVWDFGAGKIGSGFNSNVPQKDDFAGLSTYPTNRRVYLADKKQAQIVSFLPGNDGFSKPAVAAQDPSLKTAVDLAIDGNIYVLTKTGINKFQSGRMVGFGNPFAITPFSGSGKIYTQKDFKYIYVLDAGNKRVLVLDKKGALVNNLRSKDLTNPKDFAVDEKNKAIFVLNDGSLLKLSLP